MGLSGGSETIINGLSDVKLVENDASLDFEFDFDFELSGGPETIINGLSNVNLVENDTSLDFEFLEPHSHPRGWVSRKDLKPP